MSNTTKLILPLIEAAQAQKHVTHNEALFTLDTVVQLSVADRDLPAPPGGPADGVSRNGRIEESYDGGRTWHLASDGLMPAPWSKHMVERFVHSDNYLFAVLSNGELWFKHLKESSWHQVLSEIGQIKAIAATN